MICRSEFQRTLSSLPLRLENPRDEELGVALYWEPEAMWRGYIGCATGKMSWTGPKGVKPAKMGFSFLTAKARQGVSIQVYEPAISVGAKRQGNFFDAKVVSAWISIYQAQPNIANATTWSCKKMTSKETKRKQHIPLFTSIMPLFFPNVEKNVSSSFGQGRVDQERDASEWRCHHAHS